MPERIFSDTPENSAREHRLVVLPFAKSVEIAFKSIKVRFLRSLITTLSLVLAVSFLSFVDVSNDVANGMLATGRPELRQALVRSGYDLGPQDTNVASSPKQRWIIILSLARLRRGHRQRPAHGRHRALPGDRHHEVPGGAGPFRPAALRARSRHAGAGRGGGGGPGRRRCSRCSMRLLRFGAAGLQHVSRPRTWRASLACRDGHRDACSAWWVSSTRPWSPPGCSRWRPCGSSSEVVSGC